MKFCLSLLLTLLLTVSASGWSNGGKSNKITSPKFGTHDWIAYEAYRLAKDDANLNWIKNNLNAFFLGTEAPDTSAFVSSFTTEGGYSDATQCHCVLYDDDLEVVKNRASIRAQQEFERAREALQNGNKKKAAFHAGAMAHYIGDLSQFMHIMGSGSRWGSEDQSLHSRYEEVIELTINATTRKSSLLSAFIVEVDVPGDDAEEIALSVAKFVDTGGGTIRTTGWMYEKWEIHYANGEAKPASGWNSKFLEQTRRNVNMSINGIAELLVALSQ
jgi:hypothetical protein